MRKYDLSTRLIIVSVIMFFWLLLYARVAFGQTRVKACTVEVSESTQRAYYEPIFIVGQKETAPEEPEEWWVWFRERPELHKNGRAVPYPKDKVLKYGEARQIHGVVCRCPREAWGE